MRKLRKGSSPEFEDAYKAEYGEDYPNGFAPLGYDAAKTVVYGVQAAEDAGLEAGTDEYKQAVIDAIASGTIEASPAPLPLMSTTIPSRRLRS